MSKSLVVNDQFVGDLTSATGWGRFIDWADTLELKRYEEVVRLAEHGWSNDLPRLASELGESLANSPPPHGGTQKVARAVLEAVSNGAGEDEGIIIISDGA